MNINIVYFARFIFGTKIFNFDTSRQDLARLSIEFLTRHFFLTRSRANRPSAEASPGTKNPGSCSTRRPTRVSARRNLRWSTATYAAETNVADRRRRARGKSGSLARRRRGSRSRSCSSRPASVTRWRTARSCEPLYWSGSRAGQILELHRSTVYYNTDEPIIILSN